jgi:hypothetical protein
LSRLWLAQAYEYMINRKHTPSTLLSHLRCYITSSGATCTGLTAMAVVPLEVLDPTLGS